MVGYGGLGFSMGAGGIKGRGLVKVLGPVGVFLEISFVGLLSCLPVEEFSFCELPACAVVLLFGCGCFIACFGLECAFFLILFFFAALATFAMGFFDLGWGGILFLCLLLGLPLGAWDMISNNLTLSTEGLFTTYFGALSGRVMNKTARCMAVEISQNRDFFKGVCSL